MDSRWCSKHAVLAGVSLRAPRRDARRARTGTVRRALAERRADPRVVRAPERHGVRPLGDAVRSAADRACRTTHRPGVGWVARVDLLDGTADGVDLCPAAERPGPLDDRPSAGRRRPAAPRGAAG